MFGSTTVRGCLNFLPFDRKPAIVIIPVQPFAFDSVDKGKDFRPQRGPFGQSTTFKDVLAMSSIDDPDQRPWCMHGWINCLRSTLINKSIADHLIPIKEYGQITDTGIFYELLESVDWSAFGSSSLLPPQNQSQCPSFPSRFCCIFSKLLPLLLVPLPLPLPFFVLFLYLTLPFPLTFCNGSHKPYILKDVLSPVSPKSLGDSFAGIEYTQALRMIQEGKVYKCPCSQQDCLPPTLLSWKVCNRCLVQFGTTL